MLVLYARALVLLPSWGGEKTPVCATPLRPAAAEGLARLAWAAWGQPRAVGLGSQNQKLGQSAHPAGSWDLSRTRTWHFLRTDRAGAERRAEPEQRRYV